MKQILTVIMATTLLATCSNEEMRLQERASELCKYIPDHEFLERSKDYLTPDFYAVLDTLFNILPEHEALDHEWMHYFVMVNGAKIDNCDVIDVHLTDETHAQVTVNVRQAWRGNSFGESMNLEGHQLSMEKVDGVWLMSDFDDHKKDCIRHIAFSRKEETVRQAISDYLVAEVGGQYLQGDLCIPTLLIVTNEDKGDQERVWGDFWIFWYKASADTLQTVSGGNHSGCMTLELKDGKPVVTSFEQTEDGAGNEASAKRIFGRYYDVFHLMHSNPAVSEAVRREQLEYYIRQNDLPIRYYQDYGWDAVQLFP